MEYIYPIVKAAIAHAVCKNKGGRAEDFARKRWGDGFHMEILTKAAVGAAASQDMPQIVGTSHMAADFLDAIRPLSIIDKLAGVRQAPTNTPFVAVSGSATASWIGQGKAIKVSRQAFDRARLDALKVAAMTVFPNAMLEDTSDLAMQMIQTDLINGLAEASNQAFIDESNAGSPGEIPAAINYGAPSVASSGDIATDLDAIVGIYSGSLQTAHWIMHPRTALAIAVKGGSLGYDLGARGGTLGGLPAICSEQCTYDTGGGTITLLDAAGVSMCDEGANVHISKAAAVEMDDAPTGDTLTPTGMTKQFVSLFQADATGLVSLRRINWMLGRPGGVAILTGASYL